MVEVLARYWWVLAVRGLLAVIFGILSLIVPSITLITLVWLFGFYAVLDGLSNIISAIRAPRHHWALIAEGAVGITAGILAIFWPAGTAMVLVYLIAVWAIFTGALEIVAGIRLRQFVANEWLLVLMGIISVLFGMLIILFPGAGALALVFWIGIYALLFGGILIALAFRLRSLRRMEAHQLISRLPESLLKLPHFRRSAPAPAKARNFFSPEKEEIRERGMILY